MQHRFKVPRPTFRGPDGSSEGPSRRALAAVLAVCLAAALAGILIALRPSTASATPAGRPAVAPMVPATATDDEGKPANNSPQIAVDPTESRFVVVANRLDAPFNCALQVSGDGGRGWLTARPVPRLPRGVDACYGPEVAFNSDGVLYYLFVGLENKGNSPVGAFLTTSTDRGRTFSAPLQVLRGERYQVRMALDPTMGSAGRLHIVWLEPGSPSLTGGLPPGRNPIMTMHSDDGGHTFSSPVQISDPDRTRVVAPAVALGPNHSLDVVYYDLRDDVRDYQGLEGPRWTDGTWSLVLTRSTDGGEHFTNGVVVDSDIVPPDRVMLIFTMPPASLVEDQRGRIYVTWHDDRNGDWDVFLRRSTDGGHTWDRPVRVNDDPIHDGRHQYLPHVAVSPSGRVDVIFYDRRSNAENIGVDVFYAYSADGGQTFSANQQINQVTFSSVVGPRYLVISARKLIEFGSRIALVSLDDRAIAAWTDTSNTRPGIKAQDIMATEIDLPGASGRSGWQRAIGVGLAGGGVTGGGLAAWFLVRVWREPRRVAVERP